MKPEYRKRLEETVIATPIEYLLLETDYPMLSQKDQMMSLAKSGRRHEIRV